ncbi:MAG: cell wall-binding repeat-containing protein [Coriobacteriales bacterium]|jgi:hypothetical protein|nr:cell wall-binding repeat-containing protein [Coriobacteriales bacterium]
MWLALNAESKSIFCNEISAACGGGKVSGTDISLTLPSGTDVTGLTPTIVYTGESISPEGSQDFTRPVAYTMKAEDGSIKVYTVTVSVSGGSGGDLPPKLPWPRLDGGKENGNRFDTMQAIVGEGWTTSDTVIIAYSHDFPDALAASSLAGIYDAPVISLVALLLCRRRFSPFSRKEPGRGPENEMSGTSRTPSPTGPLSPFSVGGDGNRPVPRAMVIVPPGTHNWVEQVAGGLPTAPTVETASSHSKG